MSLIAQFLFQDNANDECGNYTSSVSNIVYENAPADKSFGGKVAVFNGSNSSIRSAGSQNVTSNSVELWLNITNDTNTAGDNNLSIVYATSSLANDNNYGFQYYFQSTAADSSVNRKLTVWERMPQWNYDGAFNTSNVLPLNQWHHIVVVKDGATRIVYIDGVEAARKGSQINQSFGLNYLTLGARFQLNNEYAPIKLANVRVYNSVLSPSEIQQHYQSESKPQVVFQPIATGGGVSFIDNGDGSYDEIHTFKTSGTFTFLSPFADEVQALVVGGGGGGISNGGGGGGGGGISYKAKGDGWKLNQLSYQVVVGDGGVGKNTESSGQAIGNKGGDSSFAELVGYGGGAGGLVAGGSAGGSNAGGWGPAGTTTPLQGVGTRVYGNTGGIVGSGNWGSGGGGGAGGAGSNKENGIGGNGGPGLDFDISGSLQYYGGGGAGADDRASGTRPSGGIGGGGNGGMKGQSGSNGKANTGGGGGSGGGSQGQAGSGGSGIVIVRFTVKPQKASAGLLSMMI